MARKHLKSSHAGERWVSIPASSCCNPWEGGIVEKKDSDVLTSSSTYLHLLLISKYLETGLSSGLKKDTTDTHTINSNEVNQVLDHPTA